MESCLSTIEFLSRPSRSKGKTSEANLLLYAVSAHVFVLVYFSFIAMNVHAGLFPLYRARALRSAVTCGTNPGNRALQLFLLTLYSTKHILVVVASPAFFVASHCIAVYIRRWRERAQKIFPAYAAALKGNGITARIKLRCSQLASIQANCRRLIITLHADMQYFFHWYNKCLIIYHTICTIDNNFYQCKKNFFK